MTSGIDKQCQIDVEGHSSFDRARIRFYLRKIKEKTACAE